MENIADTIRNHKKKTIEDYENRLKELNITDFSDLDGKYVYWGDSIDNPNGTVYQIVRWDKFKSSYLLKFGRNNHLWVGPFRISVLSDEKGKSLFDVQQEIANRPDTGDF